MFGWFSKKKEKKIRIEEILNDNTLNKSEKMRKLFDMGLDITSIANYLCVRYNFVYNVVMDYLRVNSAKTAQDPNETHETKKQSIIQLFQEGHSMTQISNLLKTDYNYVSRVVKEHKRNTYISNSKNNLNM